MRLLFWHLQTELGTRIYNYYSKSLTLHTQLKRNKCLCCLIYSTYYSYVVCRSPKPCTKVFFIQTGKTYYSTGSFWSQPSCLQPTLGAEFWAVTEEGVGGSFCSVLYHPQNIIDLYCYYNTLWNDHVLFKYIRVLLYRTLWTSMGFWNYIGIFLLLSLWCRQPHKFCCRTTLSLLGEQVRIVPLSKVIGAKWQLALCHAWKQFGPPKFHTL